jgi:hypothetical protein
MPLEPVPGLRDFLVRDIVITLANEQLSLFYDIPRKTAIERKKATLLTSLLDEMWHTPNI